VGGAAAIFRATHTQLGSGSPNGAFRTTGMRDRQSRVSQRPKTVQLFFFAVIMALAIKSRRPIVIEPSPISAKISRSRFVSKSCVCIFGALFIHPLFTPVFFQYT
jgi:hypothetical protein